MRPRQIRNFVRSASEIITALIMGALVLVGLGLTVASIIGLLIEGEVTAGKRGPYKKRSA